MRMSFGTVDQRNLPSDFTCKNASVNIGGIAGHGRGSTFSTILRTKASVFSIFGWTAGTTSLLCATNDE
jgi:hypothetical protein